MSDISEIKPLMTVEYPWPDATVCDALGKLLQEYFVNGDVAEYMETVLQLDSGPAMRVAAAVIAMEQAMSRRSEEKELVSELLVAMNDGIAPFPLIEHAFDTLLGAITELEVDTPGASHILANFLARAAADDVVSPAYLAERSESRATRTGTPGAIVKVASALVNMRHGRSRLEGVWGHGGGREPIDRLKQEMNLSLSEYLDTGDIAEIQRQIRDWDVPHFLHELVYEAVLLALDARIKKKREDAKLLQELLAALSNASILTDSQIMTGFERVRKQLSDLSMDAPQAPSHFAALCRQAVDAKYLDPGFLSHPEVC